MQGNGLCNDDSFAEYGNTYRYKSFQDPQKKHRMAQVPLHFLGDAFCLLALAVPARGLPLDGDPWTAQTAISKRQSDLHVLRCIGPHETPKMHGTQSDLQPALGHRRW